MIHAEGHADTLEGAIAQTFAFLSQFPVHTFFAVVMDAHVSDEIAKHIKHADAARMMRNAVAQNNSPFLLCLGPILDADQPLLFRAFGDSYEDFVEAVEEAKHMMDEIDTPTYKFLTLTGSPILFDHNRRYMGLPDSAAVMPSPTVH
jgi:hypothetical protein